MGLFGNLFNKKAKKGDNVRCIDDTDWNSSTDNIKLTYNKIYKILDIQNFNGIIIYDIGIRCAKGTFTTHNGKDIPGEGIHWAHHKRFVLSDESASEESTKEELEAKLETAINNEDYLEAKKINEMLEKLVS